jgi:hypothetical protein
LRPPTSPAPQAHAARTRSRAPPDPRPGTARWPPPPGDHFRRHSPLGLLLPTQGRLLLMQVLLTRDLVGQRDWVVRVAAVSEVDQAGGIDADDSQGRYAQAQDARRQSKEPGHRDTPATSPGNHGEKALAGQWSALPGGPQPSGRADRASGRCQAGEDLAWRRELTGRVYLESSRLVGSPSLSSRTTGSCFRRHSRARWLAASCPGALPRAGLADAFGYYP